MAWVAIAAAVISAAQQYKQGQQAKAMGDWQQRQYAADAQAEREAGIVRANQIRKQGAREQSTARAALAGSGVDTGSGTPIRIEGEIARNTEEEALNEILYGSRKGTRLEQEGQLAQMAGRNRQQSGSSHGSDDADGGSALCGRAHERGLGRRPGLVEQESFRPKPGRPGAS